MNITSIAPNMTEVVKDDGKIVLISYSTPVAAFIPMPRGQHCHDYILVQREGLAGSRTTARHIGKWRNYNRVSPSGLSSTTLIVEAEASAIQAILDEV